MPSVGVKSFQNIYDTVLNTVAEAVMVVDGDFNVTDFNHSAERITGFPALSARGKRYSSVFHTPGDETRCIIRELIDRGADRGEADLLILKRDGRSVHVAVSTTILRNGEDGFNGAVAVFRDLTFIDGLRRQLKTGYASGGKVPAYHPLLAGMVSRNKHMQELFRILPEVAMTDKAVLIEGESGTGKKLLALEMHETSHRRGGPFVPVNCAALPGALAEAALFGYAKGAFPGAREEKTGALAAAEGGSLFIEEVGSLPPPAQERLFKALTDGCFYPLGRSTPVEFRTRIIAAGSTNLDALAKKGTLREDLFRALSGIWLQLPPLRERREDVPLLVEHFLSKYNHTSGRNVTSVSPEAMRVLLAYNYPENIRELEHIMEHAFVLCGGCTILPEHLPAFLTNKRPLPEFKISRDRKLKPLDVSEKEALMAVLREHEWNKQVTARALGITRTTLWRKLKKYSIKTPPRHKRPRRG